MLLKTKKLILLGVNNKVTINGEEIIMSDKQLYDFKLVYKNADYLAQKCLFLRITGRLNDANKKSLMTSIYNYYLRKAKQDVLGADLIPQANYFRTLPQAYSILLRLLINYIKNKKALDN